MGLGGWFLLAVNLVGYGCAFRRISGQLAWHFNANPTYSWNRGKTFPTMEQWVGAFFLAAALSCIWPLSIALAYAIPAARHQRGVLSGLLYTPQDRREELMRQRIEELEREVGVR